MKRSTNVVLTLLVPAMAAFGCSRESPPAISGGSFDSSDIDPTSLGDQETAKTDDEKKQAATNSAVPGHGTMTHHRGGYIPIPWMGGYRGGVSPTVPSRVNTGASNPVGTSHPGNSIVHGGFGGTGSHLSGGS